MDGPTNAVVDDLARSLVLGAVLAKIVQRWGQYELIDHWQQGEFHHDVVLRVPNSRGDLPGDVLVLATNCNGGVKEILCFATVPERSALWHARCPANADFHGTLPTLLAASKTVHWFDPCELLVHDARSELREEFRERQYGGGWIHRKTTA